MQQKSDEEQGGRRDPGVRKPGAGRGQLPACSKIFRAAIHKFCVRLRTVQKVLYLRTDQNCIAVSERCVHVPATACVEACTRNNTNVLILSNHRKSQRMGFSSKKKRFLAPKPKNSLRILTTVEFKPSVHEHFQPRLKGQKHKTE